MDEKVREKMRERVKKKKKKKKKKKGNTWPGMKESKLKI